MTFFVYHLKKLLKKHVRVKFLPNFMPAQMVKLKTIQDLIKVLMRSLSSVPIIHKERDNKITNESVTTFYFDLPPPICDRVG